jgi:hypothetical protein
MPAFHAILRTASSTLRKYCDQARRLSTDFRDHETSAITTLEKLQLFAAICSPQKPSNLQI